MDNVLGLSPVHQLLILAINTWMFVIFPVLVLRKLNHITTILEAQAYDEDEEEDSTF